MSFCARVILRVLVSSNRCILNWVSISGKLMSRRGSGLGVPVIRCLTPSTTATTCLCLTALWRALDWALDSMREAWAVLPVTRTRTNASPARAMAGLGLGPPVCASLSAAPDSLGELQL